MRLNKKPFSVFYGWWIVAACSLISMMTGGFIALGFTAFFEPIANEFGWSYTQISLGSSFRGVEAGVLAPFIGLIVERFGPRKLAFGGILVIGFSLIFLGRIDSLAMFYVVFIIMALGGSGVSPTVLMTAVANWFRRRLGLAIGIMNSGFALGGLLVPLIVKLIDTFDWRITLLILGCTLLGIGLPISLLLKHYPQQYGYQPDGALDEIATPDNALVPAVNQELVIGTTQALRSRTFWHLGLAQMLQFIVITTMIVHIMPFLSSVGISRLTGGLVTMALPLISIVGRLGSGWLCDKYDGKLVASFFFGSMVIGLLIISYVSSGQIWLIIPFTGLFGIGWGGNATTRAALLGQFFGRRHFGSIFGLIMGLSAIGMIIGPLFGGWVFDTLGSYWSVWITFSVLGLVAAFLIATTPLVKPAVTHSDVK